MTKETIRVEGMSCGHCVETVGKAVKAQAGVKAAEVDLDNKNVRVEFDESLTTVKKISQAIVDAGFEVPA